MRSGRWPRGLSVLTALLVVAVAPVPVARAADAPELSNFYLPLERGETDIVQGGSFSPGVSYTLTGTSGIFTASGSSTVTVIADSNGRFEAPYAVGVEDVAPEITTVTYEARDASSGDLIASVTVPLAPPQAGRVVCPGQRFSTVFAGFPDGTYHLSSDVASFDPAVVEAASGQLGPTSVHVTRNLSVPMKVNFAPEGTDITWTSSWSRRDARTLASREGGWDLRETIDCFAPGETVRVRGTHALVPRTVQADEHGRVTVDVRAVAHAQPTTLHDAHLTGTVSGQQAITRTFDLEGTSLLAGQALGGHRIQLRSAHPGYKLQVSGCRVVIVRDLGGGGGRLIWDLDRDDNGRRDCRLALRQNGNLVLVTEHSHRVVWATHTAGTGSNNRFVLRDSGTAVIRTAHGRTVWSTRTARR